MRTTIALITVLFAVSSMALAEEDRFSLFAELSAENALVDKASQNCVTAPASVPSIRILSEDIVQGSVGYFRRAEHEHIDGPLHQYERSCGHGLSPPLTMYGEAVGQVSGGGRRRWDLSPGSLSALCPVGIVRS